MGTPEVPIQGGVEHPGVIDLLKHDAASDRVLLVMGEPRPWDGSEIQLFQLQEKFNAYVSFLLDGEFADTYPALVGKPVEIRLECAEMPDGLAAQMLELVAGKQRREGEGAARQLLAAAAMAGIDDQRIAGHGEAEPATAAGSFDASQSCHRP